ncbi:MAG: receptor, partial [Bacteroidia bacterium]|nr:receptor [Bacteroidia bacterium]
MTRTIFFLSILCFGLLLTSGAQVLQIDDEHNEQILFLRQLEYLIDSTNTLDFQTISSKPYENQFLKHDSYQNKDFRVNASYWLRIPVHHIPNSSKIWLFEFYDQTIDQIEAYTPTADGTIAYALMGDQYPFAKRKFAHKNFEIQLSLSVDTVAVYYFKIRSHEFADIRIAFRSVDRFINYALNEYFLYGTFYGMILIISLYNFLVYLAIREIKNIYYIFYILSVALYA